MTAYITRQDVSQLLHFAALSAAQKLGIAEIDWDPTDKLSASVRTHNPTLGTALDEFIKAYTEWFEFGERIEVEGKYGNMLPSESERHAQLVLARDNTRDDFIAALKSSA